MTKLAAIIGMVFVFITSGGTWSTPIENGQNNQNEVINIERAIDYEIVEPYTLQDNEVLAKWYQNNFNKEGIHNITSGEWMYVLISAGQKPTGGYQLQVNSITEVTQGTAYINSILTSPSKDDFVTQALTYPNILIKFPKGDIEKTQSNTD